MTRPSANVLSLFKPPSEAELRNAISRALLRIRSHGWTCEDIGKQLDCSAATVRNASNEESLLSSGSLALLGFHFAEEFKLVEALWKGASAHEPTITDRLERIEREVAAITKEVA